MRKSEIRFVCYTSYLPFGYVFRFVALSYLIVVHLAEGASLFTGRDVVQADVELLAVGGVGVLGVGEGLSVAVQLGLGGALEAILQLVCNEMWVKKGPSSCVTVCRH